MLRISDARMSGTAYGTVCCMWRRSRRSAAAGVREERANQIPPLGEGCKLDRAGRQRRSSPPQVGFTPAQPPAARPTPALRRGQVLRRPAAATSGSCGGKAYTAAQTDGDEPV